MANTHKTHESKKEKGGRLFRLLKAFGLIPIETSETEAAPKHKSHHPHHRPKKKSHPLGKPRHRRKGAATALASAPVEKSAVISTGTVFPHETADPAHSPGHKKMKMSRPRSDWPSEKFQAHSQKEQNHSASERISQMTTPQRRVPSFDSGNAKRKPPASKKSP